MNHVVGQARQPSLQILPMEFTRIYLALSLPIPRIFKKIRKSKAKAKVVF